ncbi:hypothetical protein C1141_19230 [Vibrio agarivorans]|nr:hypothetical protein C1141_19230 [Vibrio agarivorans]
MIPLLKYIFLYTQVTSRCLIQSEVTELNSSKTTKRNSILFHFLLEERLSDARSWLSDTLPKGE